MTYFVMSEDSPSQTIVQSDSLVDALKHARTKAREWDKPWIILKPIKRVEVKEVTFREKDID